MLRRATASAARYCQHAIYQAGSLQAQTVPHANDCWSRSVSRCCSVLEEGREAQDSMTATERRSLVNMMTYRAKQRGFLELDLLMGKYAEETIPKMTDEKLLAFNELLSEENPDLFKWLTGQEEAPEAVASNLAFQDIRGSIASRISDNSPATALSKPGTEWVRGWSDSGEAMKQP